jgi:hypothetical protein
VESRIETRSEELYRNQVSDGNTLGLVSVRLVSILDFDTPSATQSKPSALLDRRSLIPPPVRSCTLLGKGDLPQQVEASVDFYQKEENNGFNTRTFEGRRKWTDNDSCKCRQITQYKLGAKR